MRDRRQFAYGRRWPTTLLRSITLLAIVLSLGFAAHSSATVAASGPRYFPETRHYVPESFANYWDANGGLQAFGLPISEVYRDDTGLTVQYFERSRFERHLENKDTPFEIQLGQLGREGRSVDPAAPSLANQGATYFAETGHNLKLFRNYWFRNNGLTRFGVPLSEEIEEVSQLDGQTYTVQYFERARFEYHPEKIGTPYEVILGQLGTERFAIVQQQSAAAAAAAKPQEPPVTAATPPATMEMQMWQIINADRAAMGVPPLAYDPLVAKAAQIHVADMIANNFIEHTGSDGSRPIDRMRRVGVQVQWGSENISMECAKDPAQAIKNIRAWMMGEPLADGLYNHHWNLMYRGYTRIGISFGVAQNGCWIMAEDFADGAPTAGSIK